MRPEPLPTDGQTVLPELLAASRAAADEGERRREPLGEGELIDPNRADEVELDRLPGVGPSTAESIIAARDSGVVFRRPDDLLAVRGIGPAALERMRSSLALRDIPRPGTRTSIGARQRAVDVNRADRARLQTLPGIGPALAERIIAARRAQMFTSLEDLLRVRGIGPATVRQLRSHATVGRKP